jgi:hypothetical protein
MPKITLQQLAGAGACPVYLSKFSRMFGEEVEVSLANAEEYYDEFPWWWAVGYLLNKEQEAVYDAGRLAIDGAYEATVRRIRETQRKASERGEDFYEVRSAELVKARLVAEQSNARLFAQCYIDQHTATSGGDNA